MTFRKTIDYVLGALEIGEVNEKGQIVLYSSHGVTTEHSPSELLIFLMVKGGAESLIEQGRFSFNQQLSPHQAQLLYRLLRRQLIYSTMLDTPKGQYNSEDRHEAVRLLGQVEMLQTGR